MNNSRQNSQPTYIFKTNKTLGQIAIDMDQCNEHFMSNEYCHFDFKHSRCSGFKTIGAYVYHPLLRKVIRLATMDCEKEDTQSITLFWTLFNETLQIVKQDRSYGFNPKGWVRDEAGANWAAIRNVFGEQGVKGMASCEFHFKQSRNRHANRLQSTKSKKQLKVLADNLLEVVTPAGYKTAYDALCKFINQKPVKRKFLKHWLDWWHTRRHHIFRAFKPIHNVPSSNISESFHASWANTGSCNLSLVDAAYEDTIDAIKVERLLATIGDGSNKGGTGPSYDLLQKREYEKQKRRGALYERELLRDLTNESCDTASLYTRSEVSKPFIDEESSHRPTKPKKRSPATQKQTSFKSKNLHVSDTSLSGSS